ncbi:MAG: hypothetical protein FXF54_06120 [Kosmotoga sp.]|nr:MAG: hypothetical protein FXF54_06120 [Kosmotoga sp.]
MLFVLPAENTIKYLEKNVENKYATVLNDLVRKNGEKNIEWLIHVINRIESPEDIKGLYRLQKNKIDRAGGFYGIISEPIEDANEIPLPNSLESFVDLVRYLLNIRESQRKEVEVTGYPLNFTGKAYELATASSTEKIKIILDLTAIKRVVDYFSCEHPTKEDAKKIANSEIFTEMIKHRNSLGYVPGPEMTTDFLAYFIYLGAKKDPISVIWKWLNPWNCFNFADIFINLEHYRELLRDMETNKSNIERFVSSRIEPYVPANFEFTERFVLGIEWAIRGWATSKFGGINIEHIKDNYTFLIGTIVHETYHRIQAMLYPGNVGKDFNMLDKPLEDKTLDAMYKAMTYVFLEGTATYVQHGSKINNGKEAIDEAVCLFKKIVDLSMQKQGPEKVEEILNAGLRSNGPFYTLGQFMAKAIEEKYGKEKLATCLEKGSPEFFKLFINVDDKQTFAPEQKRVFQKILL